MTPTQAAAAIRSSAGQNWCAFIKQDGTRRDMRFRFQEVGALKGGGRRQSDAVITVWDDDVNGYRSIPIERLLWVLIDGKREEIQP